MNSKTNSKKHILFISLSCLAVFGLIFGVIGYTQYAKNPPAYSFTSSTYSQAAYRVTESNATGHIFNFGFDQNPLYSKLKTLTTSSENNIATQSKFGPDNITSKIDSFFANLHNRSNYKN